MTARKNDIINKIIKKDYKDKRIKIETKKKSKN